jgi:hypothetical protein
MKKEEKNLNICRFKKTNKQTGSTKKKEMIQLTVDAGFLIAAFAVD